MSRLLPRHQGRSIRPSDSPLHTPAPCGIDNSRPYDLRHSFISLLIHDGLSVVEVARQAGHSPEMTLSTYAHVFDEHSLGTERRTGEDRSAQREAWMYPCCAPARVLTLRYPSHGGRPPRFGMQLSVAGGGACGGQCVSTAAVQATTPGAVRCRRIG